MGKKRKAGGTPFGQSKVQEEDNGKTKLNIKSYEDVADSEDEFHINRDKVLLEEEPARKKQRQMMEEDALLEPSDEEVLGDGVLDSEEDYDEDEEEDDQEDAAGEKKGPLSKKNGVRQNLRESDEEGGGDEVEDTGGWGTKKDYYDADQIETEADALEEEAEALRLQKKQLQAMSKADFGFDDEEWLQAGKDGGDEGAEDGMYQETLPQLRIDDSMSAEERSRILAARYPEFVPLSKELIHLQDTEDMLRNYVHRAYEMQTAGCLPKEHQPTVVLKWTAVSAYIAALAMYFAVLTSGPGDESGEVTARPPGELREHPIMNTLVQCKALWEKVSLLDHDGPMLMAQAQRGQDRQAALKQPEDHLDVPEEALLIEQPKKKRKRSRKSKAQQEAEAALAQAQALKRERLRRTQEDLAKLSTNKRSAAVLTTKGVSTADDDNSDIGEQSALTLEEAAEKTKRKKSLAFYTSQITQKVNKRNTAGADAGGDADIPYRERWRDREIRLNAEAEARGKKRGGKDEALGGESDDEDRKAAKEIRAEISDDDYYDLVAARAKDKKSAKAARAAAQQEAEKLGGVVHEVEEVGADGKRAISYQIEKNKGLTPHRKKDVRNPRVKKRKKYEEKKKKLSSIRQVYKGGEGRGGYGGELTGIKKGLIRSVKL
jgi:U3 small nucleolar RNA-associated protein 3